MPTSSRRRLCIAVLTGVAVAVIIVLVVDRAPEIRETPEPTTVSIEEPPISAPATSSFRNADLEVGYVGSAACIECHPTEHQSYQQTAHSLALQRIGDVDLPPSAVWQHKLSGRWYRADHSSDVPQHVEFLRGPDSADFILNDFPVSYAVGSGHYSQSYLVEDDGFLIESPLTWYASRQGWDMSPGYDRPQHPSFTRLADVGCLACHAGRIEPVDGNMNRVRLHELAIGCENCHGPGQLHVQAHALDSDVSQKLEQEDTIVNPAALSRELQESICAECHLRGDATILRRGREIVDFRPGLPLTDFRINYGLENPSGQMAVVGHVEQMRQSRCYTETETFTCTTCHDPHNSPSEAERLNYYRSKCLDCHGDDGCALERGRRLAQQPEDNCIACHMPTTRTDLPHIAFTHHRVAVHTAAESPRRTAQIGRLVPMSDVSRLTQWERDRNLGLAYLEASDRRTEPSARDVFRQRAFELLLSVWGNGIDDGEVAAAIARLYWELGNPRAEEFAAIALELSTTTSRGSVNALIVLGDAALQRHAWAQAKRSFEKLTQLRRDSRDWELLSEMQWELGNRVDALFSLRRAIFISPDRTELRFQLAERLDEEGGAEKSQQVRQSADRITELMLHARSRNGSGAK